MDSGILTLIQLYRQHPILWDKSHPFYLNRNLSQTAWNSILLKYQTICPVATKPKIRSLIRHIKHKYRFQSSHPHPSNKAWLQSALSFLPTNQPTKTVPPHPTTPNSTNIAPSGTGQDEFYLEEVKLELLDEDDNTQNTTRCINMTQSNTTLPILENFDCVGDPTSGVDNVEVDYIFHLDEDSMVNCNIGGVELDIFIDSGSKYNIIIHKAWEQLKNRKAKVTNQVRRPNKILYTYGSKTPLEVTGSFDANMSINNKSIKATFYVIRNGTHNLLGKNTAIDLDVLRIGVQVNTVGLETPGAFPKLKGITVQIPIDKNVEPVIQPYHRIPNPLEEKVEKKLQELEEADIIECVNAPSPWVSPIVPSSQRRG